MTDGYTTVSLPDELIKKIDAVIEGKEFGYSSRPEFIKDAIRGKLKQLGRLIED